MSDKKTLGEMLTERGVSRRTFLKYASYTASILALPPTAATAIAQGIANARRQSVISLSVTHRMEVFLGERQSDASRCWGRAFDFRISVRTGFKISIPQRQRLGHPRLVMSVLRCGFR